MLRMFKMKSKACGSCPYLRSTPSGIWHPEEYEKLCKYDDETFLQPLGVFCCHNEPNAFCHGWLEVHGKAHDLLSLRMAASSLPEDFFIPEKTVLTYNSGSEAMDSGMEGIKHPSRDAVLKMESIARTRKRKAQCSDEAKA